MDRFHRGFVAGVIAGIFLNIYNFIFYYIFNITEIRFIDWTSILLFGSRPENIHEIILNLAFQLLWDGFLGVVFAYLIPQTTSRGFLIKGPLYGAFLTFVFRSFAETYRIPFLTNQFPLMTFEVNTGGVLLWGLILTFTLKKLDQLESTCPPIN